jgi:indolepyruvate ferredoxin oxidoreductase
LTAAARLAGLEVRSLDQTGLAQKGGAVVSDIKISGSVFEAAAKAAAAECDLYLGCDLLVAADPKNLVVADPNRTLACVSTTKVPTGRMISDPTIDFPDVAVIADQIRAATCGPDAVFLDARRSSVTFFGTDQYANMLLTGAAFQAGALPCRPRPSSRRSSSTGPRSTATSRRSGAGARRWPIRPRSPRLSTR